MSLKRLITLISIIVGKLIYQEILPEECDAVAVLPPGNSSGRDEILVSSEKTVWRYAKR